MKKELKEFDGYDNTLEIICDLHPDDIKYYLEVNKYFLVRLCNLASIEEQQSQETTEESIININ